MAETASADPYSLSLILLSPRRRAGVHFRGRNLSRPACLLKLSSLSKLDKEGLVTRSVSATEAKQRLAALLDAAQREPVMIRRQNRDVAVLLSPQEYDRLRALNTDEFQRFCDRIGERAAARGMTEEKLAETLVEES
jgi:prevent-host-death family protein